MARPSSKPKQVVTLEDLSFSTPNVQLDGVGTSPGVANFSIRGQGINSSIPSIDPTVGVFIDGIYAGVTYGVITDTFDLESVEIHKGPQGVLFGRNVTAGAILLRTARPTGQSNHKAKLGVETGLQITAAASVEGSLSETLAGKLAVHYKDDEGFFDNPTVDREVGEEETILARPTFVWRPNPRVEANLILEHGERTGDGGIAQAAGGANPASPRTALETVIDNPGTIDTSWDQYTLDTQFIIGNNGILTNILGYRAVENETSVDVDGSPLALFNAVATLDQDQISNELRYNAVWTGLEITAGLYYFDSSFDYREGRFLFFGASQPAGGGDQEHQTLGLFLNSFYELSDDLTLQVGLRYSDEEKDVEIYPFGFCQFSDLMNCQPPRAASDSWDNFSPKVGLQWDVSDNTTAYAHWARSYRAGGYNMRTPLPNPVAFDPERTDGFEVGVKTSFAERKGRFNAAIFTSEVTDMVREVNLEDPNIGVFQDITNTADATITGVELDTVYRVTPAFAVLAGVGYLDGEYDSVRADLNGDGIVGNPADLALQIPRLSEWTYDLGFTYDVTLGEEAGALALRADFNHRSEAPFTDNNRGFFNAYDMINAGITYRPARGKWSLNLYGKNLGDEAVLGGLTVLPFPALGFTDATYFAPMQKGRRYGAYIGFNM